VAGAGEGAYIWMSRTAVPPDGIHVANTRPLLGEFVTVTVCSPVSEVFRTVTQSVWPFVVPQLLAASAAAGTKTVAATTNEKTASDANGLFGDTITNQPDTSELARGLMADPRRLPHVLTPLRKEAQAEAHAAARALTDRLGPGSVV